MKVEQCTKTDICSVCHKPFEHGDSVISYENVTMAVLGCKPQTMFRHASCDVTAESGSTPRS